MALSAVGTTCPVLPVTNLSNNTETTIAELAAGKITLIDFWTTKCVRCPLAIEKLNAAAADPKYADVAFFTICTDVADTAKEIVEEEEWEELVHTFMAMEAKEMCKAHFGFKSVPHYVVVDQEGTVVHNVSTKFDMALLDSCLGGVVSSQSTPAKTPSATNSSPAVTPVQLPPLELEAAVPAPSAAALAELTAEDQEKALALRRENEELRKRIVELSMELNDAGENSSPTGFGSNPLTAVANEDEEYLLAENPGRFVIFPIGDKGIWEMYKKAETTVWTAEEIDLNKDAADFEALSADEKHYIKNTLGFLAAADGVMGESLVERFAQEVQIAEARFFYGFQMAMHNIHSEIYSMLIESFVKVPAERDMLLNAVTEMPCCRKKTDWFVAPAAAGYQCQKWISSSSSFGYRLVAFATVQAIFFCSTKCSICHIKKRGVLKGMVEANEKISRDESLYSDFATMLYAMLSNKPSQDAVLSIVKEAVAIEKEFCTMQNPVSLIRMDSESMGRYVEFVADQLLSSLGCEKFYAAQNPFDWMEQQRRSTASASHQSAPVASDHASMMGSMGAGLTFAMDDDF